MNQLKNFFYCTNFRINSDKGYIKLVQAKYAISNYVANFKYKKYLKYRALVKAIIEKGVEKHIRSDVTPAAILIQKHVRAYLSRVHMGELYNRIVKRRKVLKEEIQCKKIQKHFRKHFYMDKILKKQKEYEKYKCISNKVSKAFNKVLTNGKGIVKKEFQTSYVLPVYFKMFSEENKKNALSRLVDLIKKNNYCIGTGFPGTPYILFALADNGYADIAYQMLLNEKCPSWLYEVKVGGTTIWERWDGLDENGVCPISEDGTGGMISYNHYASGAVGYFLYSRLEDWSCFYRDCTNHFHH